MTTVKQMKRRIKRRVGRILRKFDRYAREGRCVGDYFPDWDWPTMHAVFPELVNRVRELHTQYKGLVK